MFYMASIASRTMQKLYSAKLLLQHFDQVDQQDEFVRPAYISAHSDAVVFHLRGALQAFLYEIAETARLPQGEWETAADLQAAAEAQGRVIPHLNRILELEKDSFSWLSQLNRRYRACWLPELNQTENVVDASAPQLIPLASDSVSDQQQLQSWLEGLQAFINDLRQTMQEF